MRSTNKISKERILRLTVGLPGCGKSSWAKEFVKNKDFRGWRRESYSALHLELDAYRNDKGEVVESFYHHLNGNKDVNEIIVDSFMTTNDQIISFINERLPSDIEKVIVDYWVPDVESCLWNDRFRRDVPSTGSIKNAIVEKPDLERINAEANPEGKLTISVEEHVTKLKEDWKLFYDEIGKKHAYLTNDEYIDSDSWQTGGNWRDCWGRNVEVDADDEPSTFENLDKILEDVCPDIPYLKVRKLWEELVYTETYGESDFYGGCIDYAFHRISIRDLFDFLEREGLYSVDHEEIYKTL